MKNNGGYHFHSSSLSCSRPEWFIEYCSEGSRYTLNLSSDFSRVRTPNIFLSVTIVSNRNQFLFFRSNSYSKGPFQMFMYSLRNFAGYLNIHIMICLPYVHIYTNIAISSHVPESTRTYRTWLKRQRAGSYCISVSNLTRVGVCALNLLQHRKFHLPFLEQCPTKLGLVKISSSKF